MTKMINRKMQLAKDAIIEQALRVHLTDPKATNTKIALNISGHGIDASLLDSFADLCIASGIRVNAYSKRIATCVVFFNEMQFSLKQLHKIMKEVCVHYYSTKIP